ncbi:MAG TPA: hypothetical protein VLA19_03905 [Herpetosiphonaceae bacterium]|nr:hypothetical protein [Herpetosiphonaceae bacterium]
MATLDHATTAASQQLGDAITPASMLYFVNGLVFLIASPLTVIYILRNRRLRVMFGIELLSGRFRSALAWTQSSQPVFPGHIVNILELVTRYWLWKSRKDGGRPGLMLFLAGMLFWTGYALPFPFVIGPLRVLLLVMGWKTLPPTIRASSAGW